MCKPFEDTEAMYLRQSKYGKLPGEIGRRKKKGGNYLIIISKILYYENFHF